MFESLPVCDCSELHPSAEERARRSMPDAELLDGLTNFFKVLGDKTRTGIVCALDGNELCVCDLAAALGMTKSAVSHQLSTLRAARLVKCRREGKSVFYTIDDDHVLKMLEGGLEHVHE